MTGCARQADTEDVRVIAESQTSTPRTLRAYGKPNQTRIWYNIYAKRWDALVPRGSGWLSNGDLYIVTDVANKQLYSSIILGNDNDDRPDIFWDEKKAALYVLASHPRRSKFWLIDYDANNNHYELAVGRPEAGVEVPGLNHPATRLGGNSPATILVTPNGKVWVAAMRENALLVQYSSDSGRSWLSSPVRLNNSVSVGVTTWSCFEHNGRTYAGLFAGENGSSARDSRFFYWYIDQDAKPTFPASWINDSGNIPAPHGREQSDDHVSAATDVASNQYFAVKTENGNNSDPLIKLYKRTPAGEWFQYPVTKTGDIPEQSRPSIVIDEERQLIHIYTNGAEIVNEKSRTAGRFTASLDALSELPGALFTPVFAAPDTVFTDVITPRHRVSSQSGTVVLVHNRDDETIWFDATLASTNGGQTSRGSASPMACSYGL